MKGRFSFFLGHLFISGFIAFLAYLLVFHIWYPAPLGKALDVGTIFWMMIGIDVVLGPLITLIVYKKDWKELRMDLSIIALVQLAALGYALYSLEAARPVWIGFEKDRFQVITKNNVMTEGLKTKRPAQSLFVSPPLFSIPFGNVNFENASDKSDLLFQEVFGVKPSQYPALLEDIKNATPTIKDKAIAIDDLKKFNAIKAVDSVLEKHPVANAYLPLRTEKQDLVMLIDTKGTDPIVAMVDLKPWK